MNLSALSRCTKERFTVRRQSVAFFLGDVGFLSDPKFRKLARRLTDPDEFNSAVGAFWIALAAARRNGLPTIDVASETDSRFIPDLVAVGLLTDDGFPEKAYVAWAPSRPPRPNELRPPVTNVTSGDEMDEKDKSDAPSPPLTSLHITSEETVERARDEIDPLLTWMGLTVSFRPSDKVRQWIDELTDRWGAVPVDTAIRQAWQESTEHRSLISRAEGWLILNERDAERRELAEERVRNAKKREPVPVQPLPVGDPAEVEAAIAQYEAERAARKAAS